MVLEPIFFDYVISTSVNWTQVLFSPKLRYYVNKVNPESPNLPTQDVIPPAPHTRSPAPTPPPVQPSSRRWPKRLFFVANLALILPILITLWLSTQGTGSEIIFVALAPILGLVFVIALALDLVLLTRYLLRARKDPQKKPSLVFLAAVTWLFIISMVVYGSHSLINNNKNGYKGGRTISTAEAIQEIKDCQVTGIQGYDQSSIQLTFKSDPNSGYPPDWAITNRAGYASLAKAVSDTKTTCGDVPTSSN